MTIETSSPEPENKKRNRDDERRRVALVLLFLLLSFICIFCSSQGALYFIDRDKIAGHMRSALQADYGLGVPVVFPRVDLARIVPEIVGDDFDLLATPVLFFSGIPDLPQPVALVTLTPTPIPPTPTLTPTSTPTPTSISPTSSPSDTPESPPPTSSPEPTSSPVSPTTPAPAPTTPSPAPTTPSPAPTTPSPAPTTPPPPTTPASAPTTPPPPPPNNPPNAVDDVVITGIGVTVTIPVLANDTDSDGILVTSTLKIITAPLNGTVIVSLGTGDITYIPTAGFIGVDTFVYEICDDDGACDTATVTVNVTGTPPIAVDDTGTTPEETPIIITVLANDSDADGDPLTVISVSSPATGTVVINPPPPTYTITYTPPKDFDGIITFNYTISDGNFTDTAMVTITVTPVNDPPVAVDDIGNTNQDIPTTIDVAANDTDVDGNLDLTSGITFTNPLSGTAMLGPGAGEITYTPNPGISGVDTFNYQICDIAPPTPAPLCDTAVVTVTITDTVPLPPINLRAAPGNMQISLGWDHTPEPDLVGYRVYRADGAGPFITSVITKYVDFSPALVNGVTYAYTVTAIDGGGNESGPSNLASAVPNAIITNTTIITCTGTYTNCMNASGPPDSLTTAFSGTGTITFDFGIGQGIIDGPGYDMVFYERYRDTVTGIRLDFTTIEVSSDGVTWFTVFDWDGDNPGDIVGTNIDSFATDGNGELEDEIIDEGDLYPPICGFGNPPEGCHGIAIDIGVLAPSGNTYRFVRLTDPGSSLGIDKHPEVDAIERLN